MKKGFTNTKKRSKQRTLTLFLMSLPGILKVFIFAYIPMIGIIIAFQDYNPMDMFFSPWNNFNNFKFFFKSVDFGRIMFNTIFMNCIFIIVGTVVALALALLLFEVAHTKIAKLSQVSFFIPYFVSYVVVSILVSGFLDSKGILTTLIYNLTGKTIRFYMEASYWRYILVFVHVWKSAGVTGIIYYTTLLNVDPSLYEAAAIDGATRWQRVFVISLYELKSMIVVLALMSFANILRSDFNLFFYVTGNSAALYSTVDVIDTYIYRSIKQSTNFGLASAVSFVQAVAGLILTVLINALAKKIDDSVSLF